MEPCVGSAPTTCRLQGGCSTNWANTATIFSISNLAKNRKVWYNKISLYGHMGLFYRAPPSWNSLVAMTRDCKSLGFGLRRFESYFQHQERHPLIFTIESKGFLSLYLSLFQSCSRFWNFSSSSKLKYISFFFILSSIKHYLGRGSGGGNHPNDRCCVTDWRCQMLCLSYKQKR